MEHTAPVIASVLLGGLAIVALSACDASVAGSGAPAPVAHHTGDVTPTTPTGTAGPTGSPTTAPAVGVAHGTDAGSTSGGARGAATTTVTASATCVVADHEDLPGMPHTPLYQPELTWHVTHATGMALSVDNPGLVGSYGTYGTQGTLLLGGGCYRDQSGSTTITFYSVGGTGPLAHRTIVLDPTRTTPTAPPLANATTTPQSTP